MKRKAFFWIGLITILTFSAMAFGEGADKVDLKLVFTQGQTFVQRTTVDQTITEKVSGKTIELKQTIRTEMAQEIIGVDESGNAEVKYTYRSAYFKQQSSMGTLEYDSTNPPETISPQLQGFAALAGSQFTMRITPKGQVLEIKGLDEMLDSMLKRLNLPEGSNIDALKKICNEENLKEAFAQTSGTYPNQPVGVGDSWNQTFAISSGFPMIMDNTYQLKQRKSGKSIIACDMLIKPNPNAAPLTMGAVTLTYNITGKQNGTMEIDEATGIMTQADLKQEISGTVTMNVNSSPMVFPIEVKGLIHCEIVQ